MAYSDVAALMADPDFALRTAACVAIETTGDEPPVDPGSWQAAHAWEMAAQPGFGEAYASALAGEVERPGNDQSVISDNQILGAVQAILA
jgi:hypothetical protein